jgi:uncharacterized protein (TIGR02266 family)
MSEQRRHPRRTLAVRFEVREDQGEGELIFDSGDLSQGGAFLRSDLLLEQGERFSLSLSVPGLPKPVTTQAKVAWVRRFPAQGEAAGMGVQFVDMRDEDRAALEALLGA